jgi:GT2 family glycosyltransferase
MGDNLLEPAPGINDKGFWEHRDLLRINESLLELAGLHWYTPFGVRRFQSFLESNDEALQELIQEARDFINVLVDGSRGMDTQYFAIKDPRLCITAPFWKFIFEAKGIRVAAIQLIRSPIEVARSLQKRDGLVDSLSHALWLDYVLGAYAFSKQVDVRYLGTFDELMTSPADFVHSASHTLNIELSPDLNALNKWIQNDLRHQTSRHEQIEGELGACVARVYEELLKGRELDLVTKEAFDKNYEAVLDDIERQFSLYNKTVIQLQKTNKQLTDIGQKHTDALSTITERDVQLRQLNEQLTDIGQKHADALSTITERDIQLRQLNEQFIDIRQEHTNALSIIAERDEDIADLDERFKNFEKSLVGRVYKVWVAMRTAIKNRSISTKPSLIGPSLGETSFPARAEGRPPVDVIIPVYRGIEETSEAVHSASVTLDRSWARLVVINDCSPEPEVTQWLRDNQDSLNFILLENKQNLGFVGTVNKGMKLSPEADVLLLNSDVEVANNWLERLQNCAYSRNNVASVTATANNATICSFPVFCEDNELLPGHTVRSIDEIFRDVVPANMAVEVPSGVGCCMYLRRDSLNELGLFDEETFGRGYGEENDWSQRAIKNGWQNFHALNVFVYHKGAVSFAEESDPRKEENLRKLVKRYPAYNADVHAFIRQDPAKAWRTRLLCELLPRNGRPLSVAVSHGLGGGVTTHILELERELPEIDFMLLEPIKEGVVRLTLLPLHKDPSPSIEFSIPQGYERLVSLLQAMGVGHVHFHHTMRVPTRLWGLPQDLGVEYDYTLHDFWVVNGNPTLTDRNGVYAGGGPDRDSLCAQHYPLPDGISASKWRELQLPLMNGARFLITPSLDTMQRIANEEEFRHLDSWMVSPHLDHSSLPDEVAPLAPVGEKIRVVVLGALSREKGADM